MSVEWLKCSHAQQDHTAVFKDTDSFEFNSVVYGGNIDTSKCECFQEIHSDFSTHTDSVHTLPRANSDPTFSLVLCPVESRAASRKTACCPGVEDDWLVYQFVMIQNLANQKTHCTAEYTYFEPLLLLIKYTVSQTSLFLESCFQRN